jgi:ribosomal protein L40E
MSINRDRNVSVCIRCGGKRPQTFQFCDKCWNEIKQMSAEEQDEWKQKIGFLPTKVSKR